MPCPGDVLASLLHYPPSPRAAPPCSCPGTPHAGCPRHCRRRAPHHRGAPISGLPPPQRSPGTGSPPPIGAPRPLHHRPNPLERRHHGLAPPPAACSRGAPPPPLLNPIRAHNPLPHLPPKPPSPDAPSLRRRRAAAAAQSHRRRPLPRRRRHRPSRPNPRPPIGARRRPLAFPLRALHPRRPSSPEKAPPCPPLFRDPSRDLGLKENKVPGA